MCSRTTAMAADKGHYKIAIWMRSYLRNFGTTTSGPLATQIGLFICLIGSV